MIDKHTQNQIQNSWRDSHSTTLTEAARLERMTDAFLLTMRSVTNSVESVQQFWDNAAMLALLSAASEGEALDAGGTITKEAVVKYQVLFLSFKEWLNAATVATVLGEETTLTETPLQLIMRQPEKVE